MSFYELHEPQAFETKDSLSKVSGCRKFSNSPDCVNYKEIERVESTILKPDEVQHTKTPQDTPMSSRRLDPRELRTYTMTSDDDSAQNQYELSKHLRHDATLNLPEYIEKESLTARLQSTWSSMKNALRLRRRRHT